METGGAGESGKGKWGKVKQSGAKFTYHGIAAISAW